MAVPDGSIKISPAQSLHNMLEKHHILHILYTIGNTHTHTLTITIIVVAVEF